MPRPRSENPTPGELEVLQVLWRRGPSTVREVMEELEPRRRRAYTSVMSLLNVMHDKGLLEREPHGRAFRYRARVEKKPTLGGLVGDLVNRAFQGSAQQLVAHALEQTELSPEQLEAIGRLIDDHRRARENQS